MDAAVQKVAPDIASGSPAFNEIIGTYQAPLLRYVTRLLNNSAYAQDIVQETFVKLIGIWSDESRPSADFRPWLYRVAHNLAVDHIRREHRLRLLHEREAQERRGADTAASEQAAKKHDRLQLVLEQLCKLGADEREVVLLRLQEGFSYKEIRRITGRTEGNIGCILHHATRKIAEGLKKMAPEIRGGAP